LIPSDKLDSENRNCMTYFQLNIT